MDSHQRAVTSAVSSPQFLFSELALSHLLVSVQIQVFPDNKVTFLQPFLLDLYLFCLFVYCLMSVPITLSPHEDKGFAHFVHCCIPSTGTLVGPQ